MRNVECNFEATDLTEFVINTGKQDRAVFDAIGYLSTWNMDFPKVKLWLDVKHIEIVANYIKDDQCGYVIVGIWNEADQRFSFHS